MFREVQYTIVRDFHASIDIACAGSNTPFRELATQAAYGGQRPEMSFCQMCTEPFYLWKDGASHTDCTHLLRLEYGQGNALESAQRVSRSSFQVRTLHGAALKIALTAIVVDSRGFSACENGFA